MFNNIEELLSSSDTNENLKSELSSVLKSQEILTFLSNPIKHKAVQKLVLDFDNFYYENYQAPAYRLKDYHFFETISDFEFDSPAGTGSCLISLYFNWTSGHREETKIFFDLSWLFNYEINPWRKIWINDNLNYVKQTLKIEENQLMNLLGLSIETLHEWKNLNNLKHLNRLNNLYNYLLIDEKRNNKYEFLINSRFTLDTKEDEDNSVSLINFLITNDRLTSSQIAKTIKSCENFEKEQNEFELYKKLQSKYKG